MDSHSSISLPDLRTRILLEVSDRLSSPGAHDTGFHPHSDVPMPSRDVLGEVMEILKRVLFPGYYGNPDLSRQTMHFHIGADLDRLHRLMVEQVRRGFCFQCALDSDAIRCEECLHRSEEVVLRFIEQLPEVKRLLATDVHAAYIGDPAAKSHGEAIYCYPSIVAMTHYRVAHALSSLEVPLIPRILTELAHSVTGIDIHPGAQIGEYFFMDHGTGIVIGETCVIGRNVRVYQGVTLGAKSFPLDEKGNPIKGIARHPIVEDDVIIYSGATILGRVRIGRRSVIGGNVWITRDVPAESRVLQHRFHVQSFLDGSGI